MTTLAAKIARASIKVGALKPDKRNTQQNYDYISADKMLERAGDALAEAGVVVFPSITSEETVQADYTDNYGKAKSRFDCVVRFSMIVGDGETQIELPWVGRGSDYAVPDKALYKAITSGHKYFLAKILNIGVGNEDGEHEAHDGQAAQDSFTKARTAQAARPAQKPATPPNGNSEGDALFTPDATQQERPVASETQLKRLHAVGREFYGDEWNEQRPKLVQAVSAGAATSANELMPEEADKLIRGIERKKAEVATRQAA